MELRWINIRHEAWVDGSSIPKVETERKLQWRTLEGSEGVMRWTDWIDVPEEYEDE